MKASLPWHSTPIGTVVRWLGSIQLAIPVLTLVSVAMVWGTYLESTQDAKVARALVYGSWWFIALMGLVCVSLIFAAITRYPWQRKHVGFLVVHASLVALIAGGFWSLFGRLEGRIMLEQGMSSSTMEMQDEYIEVVEHAGGGFRVVDSAPVPIRPGKVRVAGLDFEIVELWENVQESFVVDDDGIEPYRAVQIAFGPVEASAVWIGDEARGEAPVVDGLRVRVLATDAQWTPPESAAQTQTPASYVFMLGDKKFTVGAEGEEAFPGWTITTVKRFSHATVSAGAIANEPNKKENPAIDVTITDGKGTVERHTAFEFFPDMVLSKTLEGDARSGARLTSVGGSGTRRGEETLVVHGSPVNTQFTHITSDGKVTTVANTGGYPFLADFGNRKLNILKHFTKANEKSTFTRAPKAEERRPALVLKLGESVSPLAWKAQLPVDLGGRPGGVRYGPRVVQLPFAVKLDEFRKTDYPGTMMAMAYESDVTVSSPGQADQKQTISMNSPLARLGWKVYQSGFMGTTVSIFSVMRDPGLPLTYLACTTLCIGILITFYGRGLSWGHPGIPVPFSGQEKSNVSSPAAVVVDPLVSIAIAGPRGTDPAVGTAAGSAADPGRRTSDAAGYVRT